MRRTYIAILLLIAVACFAQTQFTLLTGGSGRDEAYSLDCFSDGSYLMTGRTFSFGAGHTDIIVTKYSPIGTCEWAKVMGGEYADIGFSVEVTSDGGFIVAGRSQNFGMSYMGIFIAKFSSTATLEWAKGVHASYYEYCYKISQTSDNGFIIVGNVRSHGAGGDECALLKFSSTGNLEWAKAIGSPGDDQSYDGVVTSDGGYIITGSTDNYGAGDNDILVVKLDNTYGIEWSKAIGGTGDDFAEGIKQTSDNGFVIAGYSDTYGAGSLDILTLKLNSTGDLLWATSTGGTEDDLATSIIEASDGNIYTAGGTESYGAGDRDLVLLKHSSTGSFVWAKTVGGSGDDEAADIIETSDGGFALTGESQISSTEMLLVKFDASGENCMSFDITPATITLTDSLTVTSVTPAIESYTPTIIDTSDAEVPAITLIDTMLCDNLGITEEDFLPTDIYIETNPNPFNSSVSITAPENAGVEIFDIEGRKIGELAGGEQVWQPDENLGSGVYLVRATVGDETTSKRIVYLK